MKSIAVLFVAMALVIAFVVASGVPHFNELQIIHPEEQAVAGTAAETAADCTFVISVRAERGFKIISIAARPDETFLGIPETGYRS